MFCFVGWVVAITEILTPVLHQSHPKKLNVKEMIEEMNKQNIQEKTNPKVKKKKKEDLPSRPNPKIQ